MKRHLLYLLCAALLALALAAEVVSATLAATADARSGRPSLEVRSGPPVAMSAMTPGEQAPARLVELRARGAIRYRIEVTYEGPQALAQAIVMTIAAADGSTLYQGSLASARVGGTGEPSAADLALADGETARLWVSVMLPQEAGNELQGASLQFSLVIQSFEDPD
jgi:hypothetical protein